MQASVPGRGDQGQRGGSVDELLQHLLAGDREASSLGCRRVAVALDGLRVGAPEDGREEGGAQRGEILRVCHRHQKIIARRGGPMASWRACSGGWPVVRRRPGGWPVECGSGGGNSVTDTAQARAEAEDQSRGGAGGLAVSGGPGGREAISGVRDVDGGSRERSPSNVERRPGARPGPRRTDHVGPGDWARSVGELGPRPLVSVGRSWPRLITSTVGGFAHRHRGVIFYLICPSTDK
jgi:hypothetical protein